MFKPFKIYCLYRQVYNIKLVSVIVVGILDFCVDYPCGIPDAIADSVDLALTYLNAGLFVCYGTNCHAYILAII